MLQMKQYPWAKGSWKSMMYTACSPSLDHASMDSRPSWNVLWSLVLRTCVIAIYGMSITLEQANTKSPSSKLTLEQAELRRIFFPSLLGSTKVPFNLSSGRASFSAQLGRGLPAGADFWIVGRLICDDGTLSLIAGCFSENSMDSVTGAPRNQKICSPACSSLGNKAPFLYREIYMFILLVDSLKTWFC